MIKWFIIMALFTALFLVCNQVGLQGINVVIEHNKKHAIIEQIERN